MRILSPIVHNTPAVIVSCGVALALGSALFAASCNKVSEPEPQPKPAATLGAQPDAPVSAEKAEPAAPHPQAAAAESGLEWPDPEGWKRGPDRPMRKATYEIPPAAGDTQTGELAVFYFGANQGGSVDANIERWVAQFGDMKKEEIQRSERKVDDLTQYIVEIPKGTYTNTMAMSGPKGPQENFSLLGAVVDSPSGKYFFKLTGPANTVKAERDKFFKLLDQLEVTGAGAKPEATAPGEAAAPKKPVEKP